MQARVHALHVIGLERLDGADDRRGDELHVVRNARHRLERVEHRRGGRAEQVFRLAGDDASIRQLDGRGGLARLVGHGKRSGQDRSHLRLDLRRLHQQLDLMHLIGVGLALTNLALGLEVAADDLLAGRLAAGRVIHDGVAYHVHAHIRRALVRALAVDALKDRAQHREDLHVAVVVDRGDAVGFQMEWVDHIHVVQVRGRRLVGEVDRVLERQVPDREGFKLRVARLDPALVLVVELGKAGRHLAAAGSRSGHDDQRARRFDIVVAAVALVADDELEVRRVVGDAVMAVDLQAHRGHALFKHDGRGLLRVLGQDDRADIQAETAEHVDQAHDVRVIGDAQIAAAFVLFDVVGADSDDDLRLLLELKEHLDLVVRLKARQHARSVVVVKELAAEFQIELAAELFDPLTDVLRLQPDVLLAVKTDCPHWLSPLYIHRHHLALK